MNAPLKPTEAVRHRFTAEETFALVRAGLFNDSRIELIDGEIYDMPADGALPSSWTVRLNWWLNGALGRRYAILPNATLLLDPYAMPSPDWFVFEPVANPLDVRGPDVLLAIEQADSSLKRDLTVKARLYARHGVRDYWVIDLNANCVHVHRDPQGDGYRSITIHGADMLVEALLIPGLSLRITDLPRVG